MLPPSNIRRFTRFLLLERPAQEDIPCNEKCFDALKICCNSSPKCADDTDDGGEYGPCNESYNECLDKCPDFDVNIENVPDEEDEPTTDGPGPATTDNHGLRGHHLMKPVMAYV